MKRTIAVWILVFSLFSVLYALWLSSDMWQEYDDGDSAYEQLRDEVYPEDRPHLVSGENETDESDESDSLGTANNDAARDAGTDEDAIDENKPQTVLIPDMDKVSEVNDELVAWLTCPDTVIDYPIAHGTDNVFYLTHLATGQKNANGCLFIDAANAGDFSDRNTIIYGHNMHSGKMFAMLLNYREQEFYDGHKYMYLTYGDDTYKLEIFSGYVTTASSDAYDISFKNSTEYGNWLKEISERSDFKVNITLSTTDRIVTLSTCAYDFANARYVLHGRLVKIKT